MMRLWVKICGITTGEALVAAANAGADAVGCVFHKASPRNLAPDAARELRHHVPPGVERVAVFLHPSQALLDAAIEAFEPDWVQLDAGDLATLELPAGQRILPVLRSGRLGKFGSEPNFPADFARVLLESPRSGHGERADWGEAGVLARRTQVVLGGGLDAANVVAAVQAVRPFGVDVSSGVERSRGVKDPERIRQFIRAARMADAATRRGGERSA